MNDQRKPDHVTSATNLRGAPLAEVLLYALTLDEDEPGLGVVLGARRELGLIAILAERSRPGMEFDLAEIVPVLENIGRRLDVAIELLSRQRQTWAAPVNGSGAV